MRPSRLDPLFAPARSLPGVGPRIETLLTRLFGEAGADCLVGDLLLHFPAGFIERQPVETIAELPAEGVVTLTVMVEHHDIPTRGSRAPWRVTVADDTGSMQLVYFNPRADWLKKSLPVGEKRTISATPVRMSKRTSAAKMRRTLHGRRPSKRSAAWPPRWRAIF